MCINNPCQMTKMSIMPIYGKTPSKIFSDFNETFFFFFFLCCLFPRYIQGGGRGSPSPVYNACTLNEKLHTHIFSFIHSFSFICL